MDQRIAPKRGPISGPSAHARVMILGSIFDIVVHGRVEHGRRPDVDDSACAGVKTGNTTAIGRKSAMRADDWIVVIDWLID